MNRIGLAGPTWMAIASLAFMAVLYPIVADGTQQPLTVFMIPALAVSAFVTWRQTLLVGGLALVVAFVEGSQQAYFDGRGLASRLAVMVCGIAIAVVIAAERTRRDAAIERSRGRALLSEAFQSSLVPVPKPPTFVLVRVRFEPGDDRLQLGGDFFDALELPDGSMGYVIGDVCGHGAQAAALGSAIRAGWKSVAVHAPADPVLWCQTLQAAFFGYGRHNDTFVTMNTGRIVAGDPSIKYVSAGHPWPVVIDGTVRLETPNVGPPLGISARTPWMISQATVPEDATMLLYTDGLIENRAHRPRHAPDERELLDYLRETSVLDLDDLLRHFGPNGFGDDVAVLAITNTDQAHLHLHTPSKQHT